MGKVQFGYGEVVGSAVALVGAVIGGGLIVLSIPVSFFLDNGESLVVAKRWSFLDHLFMQLDLVQPSMFVVRKIHVWCLICYIGDYVSTYFRLYPKVKYSARLQKTSL